MFKDLYVENDILKRFKNLAVILIEYGMQKIEKAKTTCNTQHSIFFYDENYDALL